MVNHAMHSSVEYAHAVCHMFIVVAHCTLSSSTPEMTVDMKHCAAYEVTSFAKQKVVMETNPAYEQVRVNYIIIILCYY